MPSEYETKTRQNGPSPKFVYNYELVLGGKVYPGASNLPVQNQSALGRYEQLTSRRNGWASHVTRSKDVGGHFKKLTFFQDHTVEQFDEQIGMYHYYGTLVAHAGYLPGPALARFDSTLVPSNESMDALGARFISRLSPTAPQAGLSVALAELKREGIPRLTSDALKSLFSAKRKRAVSGAGSDFLNWQFGWVPLVSDIRALAKSVMEADELLSQLYRDNGRLVRRKAGTPDLNETVLETSAESEDYGSPVLPTYFYPRGIGKLFTTTRVDRSQWFSGGFMYHLPENVTPLGELHRLAVDARYLYGLSISPEDVWNLVPWTWLSDWFLNTGDVISTFSDQVYNSQVLKYGYVMQHTRLTERRELTLNLNGRTRTPSSTFVWDCKVRRQATPFGFGLNWDGFTTSQFAILSALGLSRAR